MDGGGLVALLIIAGVFIALIAAVARPSRRRTTYGRELSRAEHRRRRRRRQRGREGRDFVLGAGVIAPPDVRPPDRDD
jgi:hypothetical protein